MKAVFIGVNTPPTLVEVAEDDDIRKFIGGWLEGITFHRNVVAYVDEEGKLKHLQPNMIATAVCTRYRPDLHTGGINGPMVIVGVDTEGCTANLPLDMINDLMNPKWFMPEA